MTGRIIRIFSTSDLYSDGSSSTPALSEEVADVFERTSATTKISSVRRKKRFEIKIYITFLALPDYQNVVTVV